MLTGSNRRHSPCKGDALPTELSTRPIARNTAQSRGNQFSASFNALPGLNFGILADLILIAAPVLGFLPVRASRLPTWNVPKPTNVTLPPFVSVCVTAEIAASSTRPATVLEISASAAIWSINSDLFTLAPSSRKLTNRKFRHPVLARHFGKSAGACYLLNI